MNTILLLLRDKFIRFCIYIVFIFFYFLHFSILFNVSFSQKNIRFKGYTNANSHHLMLNFHVWFNAWEYDLSMTHNIPHKLTFIAIFILISFYFSYRKFFIIGCNYRDSEMKQMCQRNRNTIYRNLVKCSSKNRCTRLSIDELLKTCKL